MNQRSTRTVLIILSLISLTLLMPSTGFGGAEPLAAGRGCPARLLGNITAEWVPQCETARQAAFSLRGVEEYRKRLQGYHIRGKNQS